ncbi:hypothetical protein HPB47_022593 [Ixodes persulcatus]|uniref:Uncharacterized protein n=1 Tax=Ixodes persulcatus TaxID=34615 RepID=A0AC60QCK5_IXOPE|nr:hypothetical protein HPB47_022593 [Ixodes persulcatus]
MLNGVGENTVKRMLKRTVGLRLGSLGKTKEPESEAAGPAAARTAELRGASSASSQDLTSGRPPRDNPGGPRHSPRLCERDAAVPASRNDGPDGRDNWRQSIGRAAALEVPRASVLRGGASAMVELGSEPASWAAARAWTASGLQARAAETLRLPDLEGSVDPDQWLSVESLSFEPQEVYGPQAVEPKEEKVGDAPWEPDDPYSRVPDKSEPAEQSPSFWSMDLELSKLDAMLKSEKPEALKDPTLAELNANDESGLDGLDVNDFLRDFQQAGWSGFPGQLAELLMPGGKPRGRILAERLSCSAPESQLSSLSMDEGFSSQDSDDGLSSEAESHASCDAEPASPDSQKKKKRYFWQYNVQAKGPKGPRLSMARDSADPHVLHDVTDPVFSPECHLEGVKHAGKARRGDGNDLTPNPRKLYNIGLELRKLGRVINDLTPVSELPFNARHKSRKEKNKLASRACRLKKKAQHEANKLKLYGLQQEHRKLINLFEEAKKFLREQVEGPRSQEPAAPHFDALVSKLVSVKVAGHSTEFVNHVLGSVAAGNPDGGLSDL